MNQGGTHTGGGGTVLAIETSTRRGSVALWRHGEIEFAEDFTADRSHNALVFRPLASAIGLAGGTLGRIVVGTGPGSYTGARVGIAAGHGVSMTTGAPVTGLPSVCAAETGDADTYWVVGDARRGGVYLARVRDRRLERDIEVVKPDEAAAAGAEAGVPLVTFDASPPVAGDVTQTWPSARLLVRAWVASAAAGGTPDTGEPIEPCYLGAPFVTKAKPRGLGDLPR